MTTFGKGASVILQVLKIRLDNGKIVEVEPHRIPNNVYDECMRRGIKSFLEDQPPADAMRRLYRGEFK